MANAPTRRDGPPWFSSLPTVIWDRSARHVLNTRNADVTLCGFPIPADRFTFPAIPDGQQISCGKCYAAEGALIDAAYPDDPERAEAEAAADREAWG